MEDKIPEAKPVGQLFYCGAQITPDGDYVASTFMVFHNTVSHQDAVVQIVKKIGEQVMELDIKEAEGALELFAINSWQEFADIKIDDTIKTNAFVESALKTAVDFAKYSIDRLPLSAIVNGLWEPEASELS